MREDSIANPSLFFGNFELREPITSLTDLLFALVCWYAFIRFYKHKGEKTDSFRYFLFYFLFFALGISSASFFGHALQAYLAPAWKALGWFVAGIGVMSIELASLKLISNMIKSSYKLLFKVIIFSHSAAFFVLTLLPETRDFRFSAANSVIGLVMISMSMNIFHAIRMNSRGSWILVSGIVFGFSPLFVYIFKFSFSRWFNYHDISHILMAISMYVMYRGAWLLGTRPSSHQGSFS